jgi:hypothetical protein
MLVLSILQSEDFQNPGVKERMLSLVCQISLLVNHVSPSLYFLGKSYILENWKYFFAQLFDFSSNRNLSFNNRIEIYNI